MKGLKTTPFNKFSLTLVQVSLIAGTIALSINAKVCSKSISSCKAKNQLSRDITSLDASNLVVILVHDFSIKTALEVENRLISTNFSKPFEKIILSRFSGLSPPLAA